LAVFRLAARVRRVDDAPVPLRVLIVDDHDGFRASARSVLEGAGFDVVGEATDGVSGLRATKELDPDVVLLDVQLPDLDGFEVAEQLARAGCAVTVILTSSRDGAEFGQLIAESPVRGFIPKAELSSARLAALLEQHA